MSVLEKLANTQAIFYALAFFIGAVFFAKKRTPLYFRLLFYGVTCFFMEELYYLTDYLCSGTWSDAYSFAAFAASAGYTFLLSANYGAFDSIVDDGSKPCLKVRKLACIVPMLLVLVYIVFTIFYLRNGGDITYTVLTALCKIPMLFASYFHTKHLFLPDRLNFMIEPLRLCNAVCLLLIFTDVAADIFFTLNNYAAYSICETFFSVLLIFVMITAERGHKRWKA